MWGQSIEKILKKPFKNINNALFEAHRKNDFLLDNGHTLRYGKRT